MASLEGQGLGEGRGRGVGQAMLGHEGSKPLDLIAIRV